jgi:hypothetical protein
VVVLLGAVLVVAGCSTRRPVTLAEEGAGALAPGIAARVGQIEITERELIEVARTQQIGLAEARERCISDALLAEGARQNALDHSPLVQASLRGLLARASLSKTSEEAKASPLTEQEIAETTAAHFVELDRPESFRVVHAVARVDGDADASRRRRARELAEAIDKAVAGATDAATFRARADAVPHPEIELVIEELPPVAADGVVVDPKSGASRDDAQRMDVAFASAAARLRSPGEQSGVVETPFGYHVMMLLERSASHRVPLDERKSLLHDEIMGRRAAKAVERLLEQLRRARPPLIERSAEALLARPDLLGR